MGEGVRGRRGRLDHRKCLFWEIGWIWSRRVGVDGVWLVVEWEGYGREGRGGGKNSGILEETGRP